tara:strand:+ start:850 stop:1215 length:366 start_codon:yes stop_codon:yes gene_type:complete
MTKKIMNEQGKLVDPPMKLETPSFTPPPSAVTTNPNSVNVNYGGNSHSSLSGGANAAPVNFTSGDTTFTPTFSHSTFPGQNSTFGAGLNVSHQVSPGTTFNTNFHNHGSHTSAGIGFTLKF